MNHAFRQGALELRDAVGSHTAPAAKVQHPKFAHSRQVLQAGVRDLGPPKL